MKNMDYQKMFEWVAEQVALEMQWTEEDIMENGSRAWNEGMLCAYRSINELIDKLKTYGPEEYKRQCDEVVKRFSE